MSFCDFGGEHKGSKYITMSICIVGSSLAWMFMKEMKDLREKYSLYKKNSDEPKEISFKDFHYGPIARSLKEYLNLASDMLNGIVYTVAIEKDIPSLIFGHGDKDKDFVQEQLAQVGMDGWKPSVAIKAVTTIHILSYISSLLIRKGQGMLWMCDEDSIHGNVTQQNQIQNLYSNVMYQYTKFPISPLGYALPFQERENGKFFNDILSLCDISAGCLQEYLSLGYDEEKTLKDNTKDWLLFMCHQGIMLKRYASVIRKEEKGFRLHNIIFHPTDEEYQQQIKTMELEGHKLSTFNDRFYFPSLDIPMKSKRGKRKKR